MTAGAAPVLVACSHGTADAGGRATIASILTDVRAARPDVDVREAFVDVQEPRVAAVVERALADRGSPGATPDGDAAADRATPVVVVPLLLSAGFHTAVDIADAVQRGGAAATGPLGPDPRLAEIVVDRLREAGAQPGDTVILAAAGSSDPRSRADVEQMLTFVRALWDGPVRPGFGASASPSVPDAVAEARASGAGRVVVASYLLAPGFFHDRLAGAGADLVSAPLGPDRRLAQIVLDRFAQACEVRQSPA